jgi:eukaryotic-like serine/threonine-protein kinase
MSTGRRDRVGPYKLRRRLRSDPAGTVYRAKNARTGAPVTVTELAAELVADAGFLERFRHDAGVLSRLDHPNCGKVLDYLEIEGRVYLVTERIDGRTLRQVIGSTTLRPTQALALLRGSLVGLDAAHSLQVLHRTLRPESVVVQPNGRVKLTGFGQPAYRATAGARAALSASAGISPYAYLAPEQVVGTEADVRTDIYLAGVLGFELLAGQPPFTSLDPAEVWSMHMAQDPPNLMELRPEITAPVAAIVRRALAKAPDNRQQSARDFIGQIDAVGSPLSVWGTELAVDSRLGRAAALAVASLNAVESPKHDAASAGGKFGWRTLRALVPGVAALALTLSAAADGYNPGWLGIRGGLKAGQHSAPTTQGSQGRGLQPPGAPPDLVLTPSGTQLPTPAAGLVAARVALPAVQVSPILLTTVEPTPGQPPATPPTIQPSPPGTVPSPAPSSSPSPSPSPTPTSDDESESPSADAESETPDTEEAEAAADDTEDAAEAANPDSIVDDAADAEPGDGD